MHPARLVCSVLITMMFVKASIADEPAAGRKIIDAVRVDSAPVIDGVLDDAIWKHATVIDDIHQVRPFEFSTPDEKTVFYVAYDKDALYIAARAWDSEPEKITAQILKQGSPLIKEDRIGIIISPFNDNRSGYMFELNANSVRLDGLFDSPTKFSADWDGIWYGQATLTDEGYTAEIAIPFKTLSFSTENDTWGLNVWRQVMRTEEKMGWVSYNREWNPAASGILTGLRDMDIGKGLDIIPSMSMRQLRDIQSGDTDYKLEPSLDVFYKITPSLNGSLTINTDFSATEVDARQVNLTRFNLFFPEKRSFFVKDSDIFEFGEIGKSDGFTLLGEAELNDAKPFFSRKIGLSRSNEPINLDAGIKLSGRIGEWNLGSLAIRQPGSDGIKPTNILVSRISRNITGNGNLGAIFTYGDPTSNIDNLLFGFDYRYLNNNLPGGNTVQAEAWYQQSDTGGVSGDDVAWGLRLVIPNNNKFRATLGIKEIQENFNPALGFANRTGTRDYVAEAGYTHRPQGGLFREMYVGVDGRHVDRLDGGVQTEFLKFRLLKLTSFAGDNIQFRYDYNKEGLDTPFEISRGIILPVGEYGYNRYGITYETSEARKLSLKGGYFGGDYFNGVRDFFDQQIIWRPNKHIGLKATYTLNDIDLVQGDFITRLMTFQADLVLSNTFSVTNLIQFDNVSDNLGINIRAHWNPEAGQDVFFVINYDMIDTENGFVSAASDITLKAAYTFRF